MSRSYWHTPIFAVAGQNCSKQWRTAENRKYRAYVKNLMRHERYDDIEPFYGRFGNEWDSPRDGKYWQGEYRYRICPYTDSRWGIVTVCDEKRHWCYKYYKELMRR